MDYRSIFAISSIGEHRLCFNETPEAPTPEPEATEAPNANPEQVAKEGVEKRAKDAAALAERNPGALREVMDVPQLNGKVERQPKNGVKVSGGPRPYTFVTVEGLSDSDYQRLYDCQMHAERKGIPELTAKMKALAGQPNLSEAEFQKQARDLLVSTRENWKEMYGAVLGESGITLTDGFMRVPRTKADALKNPPDYALFCDFQKNGRSLTQLNGANRRLDQQMGPQLNELLRVLIELIKMITAELKKDTTPESGKDKVNEKDPLGKAVEEDRAKLAKEKKKDKITDKELKEHYAETKEKNEKAIGNIDADLNKEREAQSGLEKQVKEQEDKLKNMSKDDPEYALVKSKLDELKGKQREVEASIKRLEARKKELVEQNKKIDEKLAYLDRPKNSKEGQDIVKNKLKDIAPDADVLREGDQVTVKVPQGLDKIIRDSLEGVDTGPVTVRIIVITTSNPN